MAGKLGGNHFGHFSTYISAAAAACGLGGIDIVTCHLSTTYIDFSCTVCMNS